MERRSRRLGVQNKQHKVSQLLQMKNRHMKQVGGEMRHSGHMKYRSIDTLNMNSGVDMFIEEGGSLTSSQGRTMSPRMLNGCCGLYPDAVG